MAGVASSEDFIKLFTGGKGLGDDADPAVLEKALVQMNAMKEQLEKQKELNSVSVAHKLERMTFMRMHKRSSEDLEKKYHNVVDFIKKSIMNFLNKYIADEEILSKAIPIAIKNLEREITAFDMASIVTIMTTEPFIREFGLFDIKIMTEVPEMYANIGINKQSIINVPFGSTVLNPATAKKYKDEEIEILKDVNGLMTPEKEAELRARPVLIDDIYESAREQVEEVFGVILTSGINPFVTGLLLAPTVDMDKLADELGDSDED